ASSKRASNTVIPALPLALNTKSGNIGILLLVLNMTSSVSVESKQTIFSHAPSLISILTLSTMASQQTESIMDPGQAWPPIPK
ncbi:19068_t:CDS:1, partial [Gigaspora margarita]